MRPARKSETLAKIMARFAIPCVVAIGTTATTVVALGQISGTSLVAAESPRDSIRAVEFTAFSDRDVTHVIKDACIMTGCDEETLHPMIKAYVKGMTPEQLDAARWAQLRLLAHGMRSLEAAVPGSNAADLAHMELTAAAQIAHFYTQTLKASR